LGDEGWDAGEGEHFADPVVEGEVEGLAVEVGVEVEKEGFDGGGLGRRS